MDSLHPAKVWIKANSTQAKIAGEVGISPAYLSDILNYKRKISVDLAVKLFNAMGGAVPLATFVSEPAQAAAE